MGFMILWWRGSEGQSCQRDQPWIIVPHRNDIMAFLLSEFSRLRPFAYHVTNRENFAALRSSRQLHTAESILRRAQRLDLLRCRRVEYVQLATAEGVVVLKDQRPLIEANTALA